MIHPFGPDDTGDGNHDPEAVGRPGGDTRGFGTGDFRGRLGDACGRGGVYSRNDPTAGGGAPGEVPADLLGGALSGLGGAPVADLAATGADSGETPEELALRRLMNQAVQGIAPRPDALDELRRAVPARRARRRQLAIGAAAALLLLGAATPSLLHAASITTDSNTMASASPSQGSGGPSTQGGTEEGGGASGPAGLADAHRHRGTGPTGGPQPGGSATPAPSASAAGLPVAAPACSRAQLGDGSAQLDPPDPAGRVYGSFHVVNTSGSSCSITGAGRLTVTGQGGFDPAGVQVVDHTAGDPATALPDPAAAPASVTLAPGTAYQVQFAWIPASSGTAGCAPSGSGGTAGGGTSTSAGGGAVTSTSGAAAPTDAASPSATPAPSGFTLTYVPQAGDPGIADLTISSTCTGTVYRTGALPA